MADTFKIHVLTPAGKVLEDETTSVILPTVDGEIGVLPHHTRYTGIVGEGTLKYDKVGGGSESVQIKGGFVTFTNDTLTVLADSVAA